MRTRRIVATLIVGSAFWAVLAMLGSSREPKLASARPRPAASAPVGISDASPSNPARGPEEAFSSGPSDGSVDPQETRSLATTTMTEEELATFLQEQNQ